MGHSHSLRGIALFVLCLALFACLDTTTKYLAVTFQPPMIVAVRYAANLALMLAILAPRHGRTMVQVTRPGWVIVRALALCVASIAMVLALQRMPIAEATAILFIAPIAVILAAGSVLGERVGWRSYLAAALGLVGVLLIARPGGGLDPLGILFATIAMLANTTYQLLSRSLASSERTLSLLFYTTAVGTLVFGSIAPFYVGSRMPTSFEMLLLLSLGVYGGLGHFFYTSAFRDAPASVLAPLNYVQLLFVGLLGWLIFGHIPDGWSLIGMAVIAGAGVIAAIVSRAPPVKRSV